LRCSAHCTGFVDAHVQRSSDGFSVIGELHSKAFSRSSRGSRTAAELGKTRRNRSVLFLSRFDRQCLSRLTVHRIHLGAPVLSPMSAPPRSGFGSSGRSFDPNFRASSACSLSSVPMIPTAVVRWSVTRSAGLPGHQPAAHGRLNRARRASAPHPATCRRRPPAISTPIATPSAGARSLCSRFDSSIMTPRSVEAASTIFL
jgi:hypothetical protein